MASEIFNARSSSGTAFDLVGPSDAPTVVLIHGLGLCRQLWAEHLPLFTEHYRVLNYDLYGHGESEPSSDETTSLSTYAWQLAELIAEQGLSKVAVVGFSIGGMINRRFAIDYPHLLSHLVILNSPHDRGAEQQLAVEQRAQSVRDQGALATMDAALIRWFTPNFLQANPDKADLVKAWRLKADPESYAQAAWVLANGVRELINPDPPIELPTLIMTGENDSGSTPAMSYSISSEITGAQTVVVPGLQHLGLIEQPGAFTDPIIKFLANGP